MVDHDKIDAALAAALERRSDQDSASLVVSIHFDPSSVEPEALARLGVTGAPAHSGVCTARLSPRQVAQLSHMPWVRRLHLAGRLRLLE